MKTFPIALFCLFCAGMNAQTCADAADFFKEGAQLEYTNYNSKGKTSSVVQQKVQKLEEKRDTLIAVMDVKAYDDKGKELYNSTVPMKCYQGNIFVDMRSLMPAQTGMGNANAEVEITGNDMIFPSDMAVGQKLPDSDLQVRMSVNGLRVLNTNVRVYDRKVEARERITTPAGAFDCTKISYNVETKLMGTRTNFCEYWFAKNVGTVRTITYDKKGNVESKMELTKFK